MNPFNDEYFMKQALVEARAAASEGEVPVNCSLYVTVEPCIMCAGAIGWAQLSTIVYGASDDKRGFSKFAPQAFHPKAIIKKGILEKECAEEMQRFFKQRR